MAELSNWRPVRDTHAIDSCAFALQFAQPVGDVMWRRVDSAIAERASQLGLHDRQPMGPVALPIQLPFSIEVGPDAGSLYSRRDDTGNVVERFQATRDLLKFEQLAYTRWAPFRERAEKLIKPAAERYGDSSSLGQIASAYVDVFTYIGEPMMVNVGEVIARDSSRVASASFHASNLWHSHSGHFEYPDDVTRRLFAVNVDIEPGTTPGHAQSIKIHTQVVDFFNVPERAPLNPDDVTWDFIVRHADEQHAHLKALLAEVLTPAATRSISLG